MKVYLLNRPDLIGIIPIFEFQDLKKSGRSDFQEEKKDIFFCKFKFGTGLLKIGLDSSKSYNFVQHV